MKPNDSPSDQGVSPFRRHAADREHLFARSLQNADVVGTLIRNAVRLQECARDQRAALQGARVVMARLREELRATRRAMNAPS